MWGGGKKETRAHKHRRGILESHVAHQAAVKATELRPADLQAINGLKVKGQRGAEATAERKQIREALKTAKAALAVAKSVAKRSASIAVKVDDTHPEIVEFV